MRFLQRRFLLKTVFGLIVWLVFWIIMDLNLSRLTIILLSENHLTLIWVGFLGFCFSVTGGGLLPV